MVDRVEEEFIHLDLLVLKSVQEVIEKIQGQGDAFPIEGVDLLVLGEEEVMVDQLIGLTRPSNGQSGRLELWEIPTGHFFDSGPLCPQKFAEQ